MRTVSIMSLALTLAVAPLGAQSTYRSESAVRPSMDPVETANVAAVDLVFGTLGFGVDVSKLVIPHVGIRVGGSYFSLSRTITQTDVDYDASLKLGSISGLVDYFPSSGGVFHLTGGIMSNRTKVEGTGVCTNGNITLNSTSYTCAQVGTLTAAVKFPSASPYLGLGFGTPAGKGIHFVFNIGATIGSPDLTLAASNSGSNAQLASDVLAQRDKTQSDINKFKAFPVVSSGIGFRF